MEINDFHCLESKRLPLNILCFSSFALLSFLLSPELICVIKHCEFVNIWEDGVPVFYLPLFNRNTANKSILSLWWSITEPQSYFPTVFPVWPLIHKMSLPFKYEIAQTKPPEINEDVTCGIILKRAQEAPTGSNKLDKQDQGHTSKELQAENTNF